MTTTSPTHTARLGSHDPTHTSEIRARFLRDVRGRFQRLRGAIRRVVGYEMDAFELARAADPETVRRFDTENRKVRAFMRWLRDQVEAGLLEPVDRRQIRRGQHWTGTYIRAAVGRAYNNATGRLMQQGVSVTNEDLSTVFDMPVHKRMLSNLYTRTFRNLQNMTSDVVPAVRDVLTQGLAEGVNPRVLADRLTNEVRDMQHSRAETLARTEVIHAYTEETLTRYEEAGIGEVVGQAEFADADDARVCPICASVDGVTYSVSAIRNATFRFDAEAEDVADSRAGTYPVAPPVHPNCRCTLLPVVN